ncbi:MAG: hypothetical protein IIZ38_05790 [Sphingomonas sp.]|uniref:hypothetical protein n=1 Tax=unclassified Sphingomonas TaxID=196159 RepID=UPI0024550752|nr:MULTISPECIES: hypothetical protein [unclassified Sphingomonas]MBQ1497805.1 hypothetical protein [Sphingomonas sp.]MDH4746319.1 hypothetical protein [Sphingomonas sp. CBMAI 2297]
MDMPPSRYRVVEQGRRLVVIDTLAGEPVRPVPAAPEMPGEKRRRMEAPRPASPPPPRGRDAGGEGFSLVTARWFDNDAPRSIRIDRDGQAQLGMALLVLVVVAGFFLTVIGWPAVIVLGILLFNPKARGGLRTAATAWLTALDRKGG